MTLHRNFLLVKSFKFSTASSVTTSSAPRRIPRALSFRDLWPAHFRSLLGTYTMGNSSQATLWLLKFRHVLPWHAVDMISESKPSVTISSNSSPTRYPRHTCLYSWSFISTACYPHAFHIITVHCGTIARCSTGLCNLDTPFLKTTLCSGYLVPPTSNMSEYDALSRGFFFIYIWSR